MACALPVPNGVESSFKWCLCAFQIIELNHHNIERLHALFSLFQVITVIANKDIVTWESLTALLFFSACCLRIWVQMLSVLLWLILIRHWTLWCVTVSTYFACVIRFVCHLNERFWIDFAWNEPHTLEQCALFRTCISLQIEMKTKAKHKLFSWILVRVPRFIYLAFNVQMLECQGQKHATMVRSIILAEKTLTHCSR